MKRIAKIIIMILIGFLFNACGGSSNNSNNINPGPLASISPFNGCTISVSDPIILTFNGSMDITTLSLTGTMSSAAASLWSTGSYSNDTLRISPSSSWTTGENQTISIQVNDITGKQYSADLTFQIIPTVLYVSASDPSAADSSGHGSRELPYKSIYYACLQLYPEVLPLPAEIHVAEGSYVSDSIMIKKDKVSVIGGFSISWTARHRDMHPCNVSLISTPTDMSTTFLFWPATTNANVLDGFIIQGPPVSDSIESQCITVLNGSPVIQNNIIKMGASTDSNVYGIDCIHSSSVYPVPNPQILQNIIEGSSGAYNQIGICLEAQSGNSIGGLIEGNEILISSPLNFSFGIFLYTATTIIRNNIIQVNEGGADAIGIQIGNNLEEITSLSYIQNNTILVNNGEGIRLLRSGSVIENNIIFCLNASVGIYEASSSTDPGLIRNNLFYLPNNNHLYFDESTTQITAISDINALSGASNNIAGDPLLINRGSGDFHIQNDSPAKSSGLDLSTSFTNDKDGNIRTVTWSIGAYERD